MRTAPSESACPAGKAMSFFLFNAAGIGYGSDWTGYRSITGFDSAQGIE